MHYIFVNVLGHLVPVRDHGHVVELRDRARVLLQLGLKLAIDFDEVVLVDLLVDEDRSNDSVGQQLLNCVLFD